MESFQIGNCRVYAADNREALSALPQKSVDLCITSPPYGNLRTYGSDILYTMAEFKETLDMLYSVMKIGGVVVWVEADTAVKKGKTGDPLRRALLFQGAGFLIHDYMFYHKPYSAVHWKNRYDNLVEFMFVFSLGGPPKTAHILREPKVRIDRRDHKRTTRNKDGSFRYFSGSLSPEKNRSNLWMYSPSRPHEKNHTHPAVFPEELAADHIKSWSEPGDTVLDIYAGSGTTAAAAEKLGRNSIMIERNPAYVQLIKKRLTQISGCYLL
jgi:site-specific DNA-methyltransferase (adenine-specific)